jgi:hypothetical protein
MMGVETGKKLHLIQGIEAYFTQLTENHLSVQNSPVSPQPQGGPQMDGVSF